MPVTCEIGFEQKGKKANVTFRCTDCSTDSRFHQVIRYHYKFEKWWWNYKCMINNLVQSCKEN